MELTQTMRWYGPNDPVSLSDIRQAGATGIVNALHQIPVGEIWPLYEIEDRKNFIEGNEEDQSSTGLKWVVVESLNIHESIKIGREDRDKMIENYCISLENLSKAGIYIVCYNFMPVLDWTRTDLTYKVADGSCALRYNHIAVAAFDIYQLRRPDAALDYTERIVEKAHDYYESLSETEKENLQQNILAGVPGSRYTMSVEEFNGLLNDYKGIDANRLYENYMYFLGKVIPVAEKLGIRMCVHPDDPPFPLFGLPRIVSNYDQIKAVLEGVPSIANGLTFCSGSLGPNPENDLVKIIEDFGEKIHFVHLRNVQREGDNTFHEADHLTGSSDMYEIMKAFVKVSHHRNEENGPLPMRPDHGHQMLDDLKKEVVFPGYSAVGRLRGLAELRGLELGIRRTLDLKS